MADLPEGVAEQVDGELFANRKIHAIKLYRDATDCSLREAKEAVDAREIELRAASPERFIASGRSGCMSMFVLLLLPALAVAVWK